MSHSILPMDLLLFYKSLQRFTAVATSLRTGEAKHFKKFLFDILAAIRASSSMLDGLYAVKMNLLLYLDGGCAMAIPYRKGHR